MLKQKVNSVLKNKTVRDGGLFSIFSFFNKGIGFVLMVILARYIAPTQYGELSIFNTIAMFLSYFVGLETVGYLSISFFKADKDDFKKDFTSICIITCVVTSLICLIFIALQSCLSEWLKVSTSFLLIGIAISFFQVFSRLNLDYLRVNERVSMYGLLSCSFAALNMFITLYLVIVSDLNWQGKVYAELCTTIIYFLISIVCFSKRRLFCISLEWNRYKKIILWGLPIIPHLASDWIKQGLDRYIIESNYTMADVGLFSFALSLAGVMLMVGTAFNQTNSVNLFQTLSSNLPNEDKIRILKKKEKYFIFLYAICTIAIAFGGCVFIPFLMPKYAIAIPYFAILLIFGMLKCVYFLYANYLFYYNKTKILMYITFGSSIFHLCLSLLFTRYSLYLTCIIYVITQTVITVSVYLLVKKQLKIIFFN